MNTRAELAKVHQALQQRCLEKLMLGVTIVDPLRSRSTCGTRIGPTRSFTLHHDHRSGDHRRQLPHRPARTVGPRRARGWDGGWAI